METTPTAAPSDGPTGTTETLPPPPAPPAPAPTAGPGPVTAPGTAESIWGAPPATGAFAAEVIEANGGRLASFPQVLRTKVAALLMALSLAIGGIAGYVVGHGTAGGSSTPSGQFGRGGPGGQGGPGGFGQGGPGGQGFGGQQGQSQQGQSQQGQNSGLGSAAQPGTTT